MTLSERDLESIWHPYTQHKNMVPPIAVTRGKDALLFDENGNGYIDAISSWWVNIHGHAHPYIAQKIFEQASTLEHVIFTGFTHEPAVKLAERLLNILPGNLSKVFYSDNGSTAVEVAIKMAIQFWKNNNLSKNKIIAFKHAYHGDTFGSMSVSDRSVFTAAFNDFLFEVIFIDTPSLDNIEQVKKTIDSVADETICFIYEPLLQAAGGMLMYPAALLDEIIICMKSHDIICIADEVMTGFGRTGKLFAGDHFKYKSDIICLSKGLTGGTLAMGVTACTKKIFDAFLSDDKRKTFFHGHSFTANPVACAAALASLDLLETECCQNQIKHIVDRHKDFADDLHQIAGNQTTANITIKDIRQLGTVVAFELETGDDGYLNSISVEITGNALQNGIYLRPLGNTVYFMPPYCIRDEELDKVYAFLKSLTTTKK